MTHSRKEAKFESRLMFDRPLGHEIAIGKWSSVGKGRGHWESLLGLGALVGAGRSLPALHHIVSPPHRKWHC